MRPLTALLRGTLFLITILLLNSCLKDHVTNSYTYFLPIYKTTAEVRANIKANAPQDIQSTGKIFLKGKYVFLNEIDKGVHIIDNSNPSSPQNIAFIDIPGNMDIAVKGNYLFADSYTDLVVVDISDPLKAKAISFVDNAFPSRAYYGLFYPDSTRVIVSWQKRDTTVKDEIGSGGFFGNRFNRGMLMYTDILTLASNSSGQGTFYTANAAISSPYGIGGSTSRFAIQNNYLYTVSAPDLDVFDITAPNKLNFVNKVNIQFTVETIYPFQNKIFLGASNGMYIFDVSDGSNPVAAGTFGHVMSCDPVVADEKNAYLTLRSGNSCQGFSNELETLDIADLNNPKLLQTYLLTNPRGLSKDGDIVFVCDGADGVKVFNVSDPKNVSLINTIPGIEANDIIAWNHIALVVTPQGLYQYDYTDVNNIQFLSKIEIQP